MTAVVKYSHHMDLDGNRIGNVGTPTSATEAATKSYVDSAAAAASLARFTEAQSTAAPNATVPVQSLAATGAQTDIDVALKPKGAGALTTQVADGTATGGDKRGAYAIDWQMQRENPSAVASGTNATIGGGYDNEATNSLAIVAGGKYNVASNICASIGGGYDNLADGQFSSIVGGRLGTTRGIYGAVAHASGCFNENIWGDAQHGTYVLRVQTTNNTGTKLTSDAAAAGASNQIVLPNTGSYTVQGRAVAREPATGDTKGWTFSGVVRRGANAAATALVAAVTPSVVAADSGASAWTLTVTADTTNGALAVTGTGENSKTIQWVATVETVETVG